MFLSHTVRENSTGYFNNLKIMGKSIKETLIEIRNMRENLMDAIRKERFATKPLLDDLHLIPKLYSIFCDVMGDRAYTVSGRKIFIFVAFYLYSPRRFFGGRIPNGLRSAIGRATNTRTVSKISVNSAELLILYQTYSDFRNDVNMVYDAILRELDMK